MGRCTADSLQVNHGWRCHSNQVGRYHTVGPWYGECSPKKNRGKQLHSNNTGIITKKISYLFILIGHLFLFSYNITVWLKFYLDYILYIINIYIIYI